MWAKDGHALAKTKAIMNAISSEDRGRQRAEQELGALVGAVPLLRGLGAACGHYCRDTHSVLTIAAAAALLVIHLIQALAAPVAGPRVTM